MNAVADRFQAAPPDDGIARLRVPPHSVEAEQFVLGSLLLDNAAFDRVADLLTEDDFYRTEHRTIFGAIAALVAANKPADVLTVHERLLGSKFDCGGMPYLHSLTESSLGGANARRYAEIVRRKALLRQAIACSDELVTAAFAAQADADEAIDAALTKLTALQQAKQPNLPVHASILAARRADHLTAVHQGERTPAFPTGLQDIDAALNGGLQSGRVYVIAARPSIGKSALALQIGLNFARRLNRGVLVLSQEMPADEVMDRAMVNVGRFDYGNLQRGKLTDRDWGGFSEACDVLVRLPLWIDDQAALKLADIRAKAFGLRREGLGLLVIDYLQLCSGTNTGRGVTRNSELEEISRGIKALAKQLQIPVLLLSQLSREVEKRGNGEPTLADLRDSGAIEQDADAVLGLWFVRQWSDRKVMALTVLKNRQGERGQRIALEFIGAQQRWEDSTADINPPARPAKQQEGFE
jgi:replicative DNA helicase